jgi:hypothetical protein
MPTVVRARWSISFDLDANSRTDGAQDADSRQIETYSCGHTVGAALVDGGSGYVDGRAPHV